MSDLFRYIVAFERKLDLLKRHLEQSNFKHFPTLNKLRPDDATLYVQFMSDLKDQFSSRFEDIRTHEVELKLFAITDSHLDGALRLSSSSLKPNIKKLVLNKRHQVSH